MSDLIGGIEPRPARRLVKAVGAGATALATASIAHQRASVVLAETIDHLTSPGDLAIVLLVGPSGVGKTQLAAQIMGEIRRLLGSRPALPAHHDVLPLQAPGSKGGRYPWPALASGINQRLNLPPFRLATPPAWQERPRGNIERLRGIDDPGALEMAASWIASCEVQLVVLNEAVNLMPALTGRLAEEHLHKFKDLVQRSQARWLLNGTKRLADLPSLSPELERRSVIVPFESYDADDPRDHQEFGRVVNAFIALVDNPPSLDEQQLHDILVATGGCVGRLRNWLVDAEALATRRRCDFLRAMRDCRPNTAKESPEPAPASTRQPPVTIAGQRLRPGERRPAKVPLLSAEAATDG